jgi:hypothetical protein
LSLAASFVLRSSFCCTGVSVTVSPVLGVVVSPVDVVSVPVVVLLADFASFAVFASAFAVFASAFAVALADFVTDFADFTGLVLVDFATFTLDGPFGAFAVFADAGFTFVVVVGFFADALGFDEVGRGFGPPCADNAGVPASRNATAIAKIERLIGSSVTQIVGESGARSVPEEGAGLSGRQRGG